MEISFRCSLQQQNPLIQFWIKTTQETFFYDVENWKRRPSNSGQFNDKKLTFQGFKWTKNIHMIKIWSNTHIFPKELCKYDFWFKFDSQLEMLGKIARFVISAIKDFEDLEIRKIGIKGVWDIDF